MSSAVPSAAGGRLGRYQLTEPIGRGPTGEVFRAVATGATGVERHYAVKRFHAELVADAATAEQLAQAARRYGGLEHPRIARLHEFGSINGESFTAIELIVGIDGARLIAATFGRGAPLPAGAAAQLISSAARAVGFAHGRGLSHLGLCPTNLLISVDGHVKVGDFGFLAARLLERPADDAALVARRPYLAPEQLAGEPTTPATDVWQLGNLGFEAMTGRLPFASPEDALGRALAADVGAPELPGVLAKVLRRALARSPFERYPDAGALADALDAASRGLPVRAERRDVAAGVAAALGVALPVSSATTTLIGKPAPQPPAIPAAARRTPLPGSLKPPASKPTLLAAAPPPRDKVVPAPASATRRRPADEATPIPTPPQGAHRMAADAFTPPPALSPSARREVDPAAPRGGAAPPPSPHARTAPSAPPSLRAATDPSGPPIAEPTEPAPMPISEVTDPSPLRRSSQAEQDGEVGEAREMIAEPADHTPPPDEYSMPTVLRAPSDEALAEMKRLDGDVTRPNSARTGARVGRQTMTGAGGRPRTGSHPGTVPRRPSGSSQPPLASGGPATPGVRKPLSVDDAFDELLAEATGGDPQTPVEPPRVRTLGGNSEAYDPTPLPAPQPLAVDRPGRVTTFPAQIIDPVILSKAGDDEAETGDAPAARSSAHRAPPGVAPPLRAPPETAPAAVVDAGGSDPAASAHRAAAPTASADPDLDATEVDAPPSSARRALASAIRVVAMMVLLVALGMAGYLGYPMIFGGKPAPRASAPARAPTPPAAEATPPAAEATPPASETNPPAAEATPPASETNPTAAETTPPAGTTPPASETAPPAETTPPAETAPPAAEPSPTPTPPVAAPAKPTGPIPKLQIRSQPRGARVYLDGSAVGRTPLELEGSGDRHRLAVILPGHALHTAEIGGSGTIDVTLSEVGTLAGAGGIKVKCKTKGRYYVILDGRDTGQLCPTERLGVKRGAHVIETYDPITDTRRSFPVDVPQVDRSVRVPID